MCRHCGRRFTHSGSFSSHVSSKKCIKGIKLEKIDLKTPPHHLSQIPKINESNNSNNNNNIDNIVDIEKMYKLSALFTSFMAQQNEYFKPIFNHSLPPILPIQPVLDEPLDLTVKSKS